MAYALVLVFLYAFQRKLLYLPDSTEVAVPSGEGYRGLKEFSTTTVDGITLKGWYWPGRRGVDLLILHGNGGHRGYRLEWIESFHRLGLGVCIIDYRGYGGSGGAPAEEGLYRDAEAARAWLEARSSNPVVYFGESLGCGVAVELACRKSPAALILQAGFSSAVDVAQRTYFFVPVRLLLKDRYDSASRIGNVRVPSLFIHGESDRIIPIRFGRKLYEAAPEPKEWVAIPGAHHNDLPWVAPRRYLESIDSFLQRHVEEDA